MPPTIDAAILRRHALEIFRAGLEAADPARAVHGALAVSGGGSPQVLVGGKPVPGPDASPVRRVRVVAFGKAALAMARAAATILPPGLFPGTGVAVTTAGPGSKEPIDRFQTIEAGHPLPDQRGIEGARAVAEALSGSRKDELSLILISGGGSALLPAPAPGISLEDKIGTTGLLLSAGADIVELNTVRKHLSSLKGGGLARVAAPAQVRALILSDVIHNDLAVIASGPLVPDPTTFADALRVLVDRDVIHRVPPSVRERLTLGVRGDLPETPKPGDPIFTGLECVLVGSNSQSRQAARTRAGALGYTSSGRPAPITGEAREGAATLARAARVILSSGAPGRFVLVTGGETTVTVRGKGRGGRSQEMALALALALEDLSAPRSTWAFLAAGTDGIDGPTDAAGGIVDGGTIGRIRSAGMDPHAALKDNDSHAALAAAGDLVKTGPTGTNVADLQVLLVVTGPREE